MVCNSRNGGNNAGKKKLTVTEADRSMNVFIEEGYLQVNHQRMIMFTSGILTGVKIYLNFMY